MSRGIPLGPVKFAIGRRSLPVLVMTLAACAGGPGVTATAETICVEPRPEVCTMDYRPVCARLASGESRTYANACGACADPETVAHTPGACE